MFPNAAQINQKQSLEFMNVSWTKTIVIMTRVLFAVPWLIFGLQHFMYVNFVASLVPSYLPVRMFWAYFTGAAMIAAGISFLVNQKAALAAALLGVMLMAFILLIHFPQLASGTATPMNWIRFSQDLAITTTAFMLMDVLSEKQSANNISKILAKFSRYLYAALLIIFGIQQFLNLDFLTAKVPTYLPLRTFWIYLTGLAMIIAGTCIIFNQKARLAALLIGAFLLLINLLHYVYLLANDFYNPLHWTAAMINVAIICGAFVISSYPTDIASQDV